jgi:hypothetical protein
MKWTTKSPSEDARLQVRCQALETGGVGNKEYVVKQYLAGFLRVAYLLAFSWPEMVQSSRIRVRMRVPLPGPLTGA